MISRTRSVLLAVASALIGVLFVVAVIAAWAGDFVGFSVAVLLGGLAMSLIIAVMHRTFRPETSADPFVRDVFAGSIINFATLRVAGVGGVGLMIVAALVAVQFQLVAMSVGLGALGGLIGGVAMIMYRHRHPSYHPPRPLHL